uniref:Uncharacterized protein n=1 Tax=Arundo donax TaxID=35708 RepID=A0A0A8Z426_ARUDO
MQMRLCVCLEYCQIQYFIVNLFTFCAVFESSV